MATSRNRIIYQSQALFIGPSSTGYHIQTGVKSICTAADRWKGPGSTGSYDDGYCWNWTGSHARYGPNYNAPDNLGGVVNRSLIEPLTRVQSANFNFTLNRQDVNEFGRLARLDSIILESPTVGLDFNYYLLDGENERKMGFNVPSSMRGGYFESRPDTLFWTGDGCLSGVSALSGILDDPQGNNYFITVVPDGQDVQGTTDIANTGIVSASASVSNYTKNDVICIGNGFISDYTVEASVGAIPTASVTVEGFNIKVDDHLSGAPLVSAGYYLDEGVPGVTLAGNSGINRYLFETGVGNTGIQNFWEGEGGKPFNTTGNAGVAALRPGDLLFSMTNSGSYFGFTDMDGDGAAHIQSFSINVPLSRTVLQKLGSTFGYARVVDLPVDISCTVSAVVSELQQKNIFSELCNKTTHDFSLTLRDSSCTTAGDTKLKYTIKNARLEGETFTSTIGDNETVDMTFTSQIGGANDQENGIFMEGSYPTYRTLPYWPLGKAKDNAGAYSSEPDWIST